MYEAPRILWVVEYFEIQPDVNSVRGQVKSSCVLTFVVHFPLDVPRNFKVFPCCQ